MVYVVGNTMTIISPAFGVILYQSVIAVCTDVAKHDFFFKKSGAGYSTLSLV